jgi:hypothetical protein
VAIKWLWFKWLGPYHWSLISGIKGLRIELMGMCQVFIEPQRHSWKGSSKVLRKFEGPQSLPTNVTRVFPSEL